MWICWRSKELLRVCRLGDTKHQGAHKILHKSCMSDILDLKSTSSQKRCMYSRYLYWHLRDEAPSDETGKIKEIDYSHGFLPPASSPWRSHVLLHC